MTTAPARITGHATGSQPPPAADRAGRREQRQESARAFRPRRVVPATVAAVLLAAAAILTAIEVVAALLGRQAIVLPVGRLARLGQNTRFDDPLAITAAAVLCVLGLTAIILAVKPGRPRLIALHSPDRQTVIGITRTALRRQLAAAATRIDGIGRARIRVRRRRIRVRATSPLRDPSELAAQMTDTVTVRLQELAPLRPLRVRATVRRRRD